MVDVGQGFTSLDIINSSLKTHTVFAFSCAKVERVFSFPERVIWAQEHCELLGLRRELHQ